MDIEQIKNNFITKKYSYINSLLNKDECELLTASLKKAISDGITLKDKQCPISEGIYGLPNFDFLLENLLPKIETISGKKLLPTYSYARMYSKGEVLKPHKDRPSCQISVTLTLGSSGHEWPIFMADPDESGETLIGEHNQNFKVSNKASINLNVGDAVIYRGEEKIHWRDTYKGEWQAQVFLHYVDADSTNAEWAFDKRPCLSHRMNDQTLFWSIPSLVGKDTREKIISVFTPDNVVPGLTIGAIDGEVNKDIRDVNKVQLAPYAGIGAMMAGVGLQVNSNVWKFNVTHQDQSEALRYDKDGHYVTHIDTLINSNNAACRKLTVLTFLNNDFEGGKLYLMDGGSKFYPPQEPGSVLVFPSFIAHGVEPVISGVRYSVVTWLVGPWFK